MRKLSTFFCVLALMLFYAGTKMQAQTTSITLTFNYVNMAGTTTLSTATTQTVTSGNALVLPTLPTVAGYTYDHSSVEAGTAITADQTIKLYYKLITSIDASDAPTTGTWTGNEKWYAMMLRDRYCVYNPGLGGVQCAAVSVVPYIDAALWCFVGDAENGYKIMNKAAGTNKILWAPTTYKSGSVPMTATEDATANTEWELVTDGSTYNNFLQAGTTNHYFTYINTTSMLCEWVSDKAKADVGSAIKLVPEDELALLVAGAAQTKIGCVGGYTSEQSTAIQTALITYNNSKTSANLAALKTLVSSPIPFDANKYYRIENKNYAGYYISTLSDNRIEKLDNASPAQVFKFEEKTAGSGVYGIKSNGQYLGATSKSTLVGLTNAANSGSYVLSPLENGTYSITLSGHTVCDASGNLHCNSGHKLVGWKSLDVEPSHWYLIPATTLDFNVTDAGYATTYLPFNFTLPTIGLTAYKLTAFNSDKTKVNADAVATDASPVLPMEIGLVVKGSKGTYTLGISSDNATADVTNNKLRGTLLKTNLSTADAANTYLLHATDGDATSATFYKLSDTEVLGNKAYLYDDTASGVAAFTVSFGDITGINSVPCAAEEANGVYYNLVGQRINHPAKGVYIHNGKKFIVK
jgi:hypothetical protein